MDDDEDSSPSPPHLSPLHLPQPPSPLFNEPQKQLKESSSSKKEKPCPFSKKKSISPNDQQLKEESSNEGSGLDHPPSKRKKGRARKAQDPRMLVERNVYCCPDCDVWIRFPALFHRHILSSHGREKVFRCTACDRMFQTDIQGNDHIRKERKKATGVCHKAARCVLDAPKPPDGYYSAHIRTMTVPKSAFKGHYNSADFQRVEPERPERTAPPPPPPPPKTHRSPSPDVICLSSDDEDPPARPIPPTTLTRSLLQSLVKVVDWLEPAGGIPGSDPSAEEIKNRRETIRILRKEIRDGLLLLNQAPLEKPGQKELDDINALVRRTADQLEGDKAEAVRLRSLREQLKSRSSELAARKTQVEARIRGLEWDTLELSDDIAGPEHKALAEAKSDLEAINKELKEMQQAGQEYSYRYSSAKEKYKGSKRRAEAVWAEQSALESEVKARWTRTEEFREALKKKIRDCCRMERELADLLAKEYTRRARRYGEEALKRLDRF